MESILEKIKEKLSIDRLKGTLKHKSIWYTVTVVGGVVTIAITAVVWPMLQKNAYAVAVDGTVIGIVQEKEQAQHAYREVVNQIKEDTGVDIVVNEVLSVEHVRSKAQDIVEEEEIVVGLKETITYDRQACEVFVNGVSYGVVEDEQVALEVLQAIAQEQANDDEVVDLEVKNQGEIATASISESVEPIDGIESSKVDLSVDTEIIQLQEALPQDEMSLEVSVGEIEIIDIEEDETDEEEAESEGQVILRERLEFDFAQEIELKSTYVQESEIIEQEELTDILLSNTDEVIEYELQAGDNIWDLAVDNGTTMDRILEINPQIEDERKMQIGEVIRIEAPDPIVSIVTKEEATFKQVIPAEIEYVEFSDMYEGDTKVYQEGYDGVKEINVIVERVNGREVDRELISETVLKEPKTKVIAYGTQEKPASSSGSSSSSSSSSSGSSVTPPANSGQFMHPLAGAGRYTSGYGSRWGSFHKGVDIAASYGTPIYASAAGTVTFSGWNGSYGNLVIIDHGNGYETYYAHNSKNLVSVGQKVSKGQNIAQVGSTGNSTGNHVHFEIRVNGSPINPYSYIY